MTEGGLAEAMAYARSHAEAGLRVRPFDSVLRHTLDQLALIGRHLAATGNLSGLRPGDVNLGLMAAKELGNDEADFAHALSAIQWDVDTVTGERLGYRP